MKLLIVDDDKTSGEFLLKVLSEYGHCDIAIDGIEAVDAFIMAHDEGAPYDLISLDLMLPLLDGESVLAAIRRIENERKIEIPKRVRVVVTSALNDNDLTESLKKFGIDKYFIKPIDIAQMRSYFSSISGQ